ncbi:hypothetical protein B296_00053108 [Ensete ventricosum]|uniref:Uncharacterized protein n=1 Tax=Ensete ventricosum TaxID=4639 RepID=A0A426Y9K3_ENSVE|nr:hypothetical protein B296_00053108 [Ensete ventricosum]
MQCLVVTHGKGARGLPPARPPLRRGATRWRSEWAAACWTRTRRCSTASCRRCFVCCAGDGADAVWRPGVVELIVRTSEHAVCFLWHGVVEHVA